MSPLIDFVVPHPKLCKQNYA